MNTVEEFDSIEIISNLGTDNLKFADKTVLLVGCAGLLGSLITNYFITLNKTLLSGSPVKVLAVDNYIIGNTPKVYEDANFTVMNHDICVPFDTKISPDQKIDFILNLAGIASPAVYTKFPVLTLDISYIGTKNILNLAYQKKVSSVICMSSSEVYGDPDEAHIPTKEDYNGNMCSTGERACYDEGKRVLETTCDIYHRLYGVPVKVVRPFNVFGAGMSLKDKRVVSSYINNALQGKPLTVYGEGNETRTFCYATDFLTGLVKLLFSQHNGQIFNLGNSDNEISMRNLAVTVAQIVNNPDVIVQFTEPPAVYKKQPQRRCPDLTKVREAIGYSPKVNVVEGISRFWYWAQQK